MATKLVSSFQRIKSPKFNDTNNEQLFSTVTALKRQSIENPGWELPLDCNVRASLLPLPFTDIRSLKQSHTHIIISGLEQDVFIGTKLVNGYAKYGSIVYARQVFDKMPTRDLVLWTALISGYAQNSHPTEALSLFHQMQLAGIMPDQVTVGLR